MQEPQVVEVSLPNGSTTLAEVTAIDGIGATKASVMPKFDFEEVGKALEGVATAVKASVAKTKPDKVVIELGLKLTVKSGKLTCLVVEGQGEGSLTVSMEWEGSA